MITFADGSKLDNVFHSDEYDNINLEGHGKGVRIDITEKKYKYKIRITNGNDDKDFFLMKMTMKPSNMFRMISENGGPELASKLGFVKLSLELDIIE